LTLRRGCSAYGRQNGTSRKFHRLDNTEIRDRPQPYFGGPTTN